MSERLQFKTLGELAAAAEEHMLDPIGRNLGIAVGSEYAILFVDGSTSATIVPLVKSAPRDRSGLLKIELDQKTLVRLSVHGVTLFNGALNDFAAWVAQKI